MARSVSLFPSSEGVIHEYFRRLLKDVPWSEIETADVVFLLVDKHTANVMEDSYSSFYGKKVIAYVIELSYCTLPLLKMADYIIYQKEEHREIAEWIVEYSIPYSIAPLPQPELPTPAVEAFARDVVIYSDFYADEAAVHDFVRSKVDNYSKIFFITSEQYSAQDECSPRILYRWMYELPVEPISRDFLFFVMEDEFKKADITRRIHARDKEVVYYPLKGNLGGLVQYCLQGLRAEDMIRGGVQFEIHRALERITRQDKEYIVPDTLGQLNVIAGKPLTNRFVFSICFRNLSHKLIRCITSICRQRGEYDVGVAIIDDASDFSILEQIQLQLEQEQLDYILVQNTDRKFAARNFYNVIHHLVINDQAFLIELDGDDYLYGDQVLEILDHAVNQGALKTRGNFAVDTGIAIREGMFKQEKLNMDFDHPRNLSRCSGWYHLRMTQVAILRQVEIEHFLEKGGTSWLKLTHDASVHSRAFELARPRIMALEEVIYVYDVTGTEHDAVQLNTDNDLDSWEYGNYLLQEPYLFKLFIPLFEEPRFIPSRTAGEGLIQV